MRDVAVTGRGILTPLGADLDTFWGNLVVPAPRFERPADLPVITVPVSRIESADFVAHAGVPSPALCDRSALLAVSATRSALGEAGLGPDRLDPGRVAVIVGSGAAGVATVEEQYDLVYRRRLPRASPLTVPRMMASSPASWVAMIFGLRGPAFGVTSACASATHAIGLAARMVESGIVDVAVCGGTEAMLVEGPLRAWESLGVLSPDTCRPFSAGRQGIVLAEGAGMLVLESEAHRAARGAPALAFVAGSGSSADAAHLTKPAADGMASAMTAALADAGLAPTEVDYVNAHGTGTAANDPTETQALRSVFGPGGVPLMSSTKGTTGHALGASGGIEAIATLLAIEHSTVPPTANYEQADPACDLDCVPNVARKHEIRTAMSNSFAFGGLNASLVFRAA